MGDGDRNLHWHRRSVTREDLAGLNGHRGATVWLTGLSAAGKSTLANAAARTLHGLGVRTYVLDGDNVRHGLCADLGFSPQDRQENIRRVAEVAKLLTDAGLVVFAAFISPYRADRAWARALQPEDFVEVHVDCSIAVCEGRDPKGIYRKARAGQIADFTGISAPYEAPVRPEVYLDTATSTIEECVETLATALVERDVIRPAAPAGPAERGAAGGRRPTEDRGAATRGALEP
jgi:adenylylsulfate kinase